MKPMQNTIAPRTPLTIAELETLAVMLDSGTRKMAHGRRANGEYAWPQGLELTEALGETLGGFYEIRNNTAILVTAASGASPLDCPEGQIVVAYA